MIASFYTKAHRRVISKKLKKNRGMQQARGVADALNVLGDGDVDSAVVTSEECEDGEECFDITQNQFGERRRSLSTGLVSDDAADAKKQRMVNQAIISERRQAVKHAAAESQSPNLPQGEVDCEEGEEECFDITQNKFSERTKSLSTGLPPSNTRITTATRRESQVKDFLPKREGYYYDITQNLFPEQRRASSTFSNLASGNVQPNPSDQRRNPETDVFDITQNLFPEHRVSQSTSRLSSAFGDGEKSEMNSRPPPAQAVDGGFVLDINKVRTAGDRSLLSRSVNGGAVKSDDGVVASPAAAAAGSKNVVLANGAKVKSNEKVEGTSANVDSSESSVDTSNDYVDITKQHFGSERPSKFVNTGGQRRRGPEFSDDYVDITKQHFPDRSSFSQLVNSGTKKDGTTYGSWDESRLLPMPERTKDASWRWKRTPNSQYLNTLQFSSDLCPPSLGKPGLSESRQPLSATANVEPKQRFNTSDASYRDIFASYTRQPLSATANVAKQQRFNTSTEIYRDASVSLEPQPLSLTANAAPKQRFNTTQSEMSPQPLNMEQLSSIAYGPPRQRFKTPEEGYKDNAVLSNRQPLDANAAPEQRFKTKEKRGQMASSSFFSSTDSKNAQPLDVHTSNKRFGTVGRKTLLTTKTSADTNEDAGFDVPRAFSPNIEMVTVSPGKDFSASKAGQYVDNVQFSAELASSSKVRNVTASKSLETNRADEPRFSSNLVNSPSGKHTAPKAPTKVEPPLSMTIHVTADRFNTTKKSSSSFVSQTVGFDVPRAFTRNIDMVTTSEAKRGEGQEVDKIQFSSNLSASTQVRNMTMSKSANSSNEEYGPDANLFSPILSESTTIRKIDYTKSASQSDDIPLVDEHAFSADLARVATPKHKPGSGRKSTPRSHEYDTNLVDENRFSPDLTRVSNAKHKPGSAMKSSPQHQLNEDMGIDLNQFSPISDLSPPSKVREVKASTSDDRSDSADQHLDLSSRKTVNIVTSKPARSAHAASSDDPFVDQPKFSKPESLIGPLKVRDLRKASAASNDLGVDRVQFSPSSKLRPPSQVRLLKPKKETVQEKPKRAPHVNAYFQQFSLEKESEERHPPENDVMVDRFLDLSSQYTVNNSSMTALGSHAIMSDDPYVDVTRFSSPSDFAPPSKVKTYRAVQDDNEEDYFDITQASLSDGSLARNVSSVRDAIASSRSKKVTHESSSLLRNVSSVRDALSASKVKAEDNLKFDSPEDEVKHWLLSRLPHLEIGTAESYVDKLIEDGFDSFDMLDEIIVDDIEFMEDDHRESLVFFMDLKYWLLAYLPDLDEADIASYSEKLIADGFDSFEMLDELTINDVSFMKTAHRRALAKHLPDLSIGSPKEAPKEEPSYDITRDAFQERPSLASVPNHHLSQNKKARKSTSVFDDEAEDSFDITRVLFPDRPSLAIAQQHKLSETMLKESRPYENDDQEQRKVVKMMPKAELYQFYISKGLSGDQASELNDFYTVLSNKDGKFSCVFTCPISGESFLAGHWVKGGEVASDGQVYWYSEFIISLQFSVWVILLPFSAAY